ncbi:MAG: dienelactone hydrolase family protein [Hyphomonas sp.]|uniref:dienelactone hydrolase family protein n=1 Tax=Hyphomonas sp. TaxID=87 RepID=UPI003528AFD6
MADGMDPKKIPQGVFDLYDAYCHGRMSRRAFFANLKTYAVGGLTVSSLAACMMPDYSQAQTVEDEEGLVADMVLYQSPRGAGEMAGYFVRPAGSDVLPGVVVVHENRGLNPHIKDVARRVALAGYVAFAPDALYPLGGYPGTDDEGRELQKQRTSEDMLADFMAAAEFLRNHEATTGKIGCTGFCFGGAITNLMAVKQPWLGCAVPYYGGWPSVEEAATLQVPLMEHMAETDGWVNAGWPAYKAALDAAGKTYEAYTYPGTQHGFNNDTTPRYDAEAAALAWGRTLDFFKRYLT